MKRRKPYTPHERLAVLSTRNWLDASAIMIIADCGETLARKILSQIVDEIETEGYLVVTRNLVPTERLIKRLGIDLDFLRAQIKSAPLSLTTEGTRVESPDKDSTSLYHSLSRA